MCTVPKRIPAEIRVSSPAFEDRAVLLALVHRARDCATGEKLNLLLESLDGRQSRFFFDGGGGGADYHHQIDKQGTRDWPLASVFVLET